MKALTILITGGIGSGKSELSRYLEANGVPVYDSDSRTKALYEGPLGTVLEKEFGMSLYDGSGHFDRKRLAALVFSDGEALHRLESIVHPAVLEDFLHWREEMLLNMDWKGYCGTAPLVCMESAIALDKPLFAGVYDIVLMVDAPEDVRVMRACRRDSVDEAVVRRRIRSQRTDRGAADYVIENDGSPDDLMKAADNVFRQIAGMQADKNR